MQMKAFETFFYFFIYVFFFCSEMLLKLSLVNIKTSPKLNQILLVSERWNPFLFCSFWFTDKWSAIL